MAGMLRITGGSLVRRRFMVPKEADAGLVRPTPDRVRTAIFSSLGERLQNARVLDIFAGSGSSSFEALSRGAQSAVLIELSPATAACIKANIEALGLTAVCRLVVKNALQFVKQQTGEVFDVIFVDPPYPLKLESLFWQDLLAFLAEDALVVYRCDKKDHFHLPSGYQTVREKDYAGTRVFFLTQDAKNDESDQDPQT